MADLQSLEFEESGFAPDKTSRKAGQALANPTRGVARLEAWGIRPADRRLRRIRDRTGSTARGQERGALSFTKIERVCETANRGQVRHKPQATFQIRDPATAESGLLRQLLLRQTSSHAVLMQQGAERMWP